MKPRPVKCAVIESRILHLTDERCAPGLLRGAMSAGERESERRRIIGMGFAGDIMEARHCETDRIDPGIVFAGDRPP